jgi:hypothetical protein
LKLHYFCPQFSGRFDAGVPEFESHHFCPQFPGAFAAGDLPSSFSLCARPAPVPDSSPVCNNPAVIPPHLGKELTRLRLYLPRISAEVRCGFPSPSTPLRRRPCWISAVRGDSFARGASDEGFDNRILRERLDFAEVAQGTRSRNNTFRDGGDQESLVPGKGEN